MIKAFISHSSNKKTFVEELRYELGGDFCIVDCYDFEPAYRTIDEIYRKIEASTVFVLLITKDSLASDWVDKEIKYAYSKLKGADLDRFWPYIIDDKLEVEDCPEWMKHDECFNLKKFKSPIRLARDIEQKFRKIIWSQDSRRKYLDNLLIGRNSDIDKFESLLYSSRGDHLKALIISGREGVGKDMFIAKCMQKIGKSETSRPFSINLGYEEGVENLIIQLNKITRTYEHNQLIEELAKSTEEKTKSAISLINDILNSGDILAIDDNYACVLNNRHIAEWLTDMLDGNEVNSQFGIFIKSRLSVKSFEETDHPHFGHIQLEPLNTSDRTKLFYGLMKIYNVKDIKEEDVKWFVGHLLQSPSQIAKAVEALSYKPLMTVKRDIDQLVQWGDRKIKPFVKNFFDDDEQRNLLIIISKLDFVSYEILQSVFGERIKEIMEKMLSLMDYGIVTTFGVSDEFFRLDHYFSDYIRRCRIELPDDIAILLNDNSPVKPGLSV